MSTGPIVRKSKNGPRKVLFHEIMAASSAWGATSLYKGDANIAVAANSTESSGGEWPILGLDPNKKYVITHMRAVFGAAPGSGKTITVVLRQDGSDSSDGAVTVTGDTNTSGEVAFQDLVTHGAYVSVKVTATAGTAASTMKVFLTIEEV